MNNPFAEDVEKGLAARQKYLPSKYFYDEKGNALFIQIMQMPEYYLTDCEMEIFAEQSKDLIQAFEVQDEKFELYELGAGDGSKTIELIKGLDHSSFKFIPIDISEHVLEILHDRLQEEVPDLRVETRQGDYFEMLGTISSPLKKIILFLGSNIGNLTDVEARSFISRIASKMNPKDMFLLGVDLKKSARIILAAYNDPGGITRRFNLNLLERINKELGGTFDTKKFSHQPVYSSTTGYAISYLRSKCDQEVSIRDLSRSFKFRKGETIHMEISRKYDLKAIRRMIHGSGLELKKVFYDKKKFFGDILLEKRSGS